MGKVSHDDVKPVRSVRWWVESEDHKQHDSGKTESHCADTVRGATGQRKVRKFPDKVKQARWHFGFWISGPRRDAVERLSRRKR